MNTEQAEANHVNWLMRSALSFLIAYVGLVGVAEAQDIAIANATVYTSPGVAAQPHTTVLIEGGKIVAVGNRVSVPSRWDNGSLYFMVQNTSDDDYEDLDLKIKPNDNHVFVSDPKEVSNLSGCDIGDPYLSFTGKDDEVTCRSRRRSASWNSETLYD